MECAHCKNPFKRRKASQRFCSHQCVSLAAEARNRRACEHCKNPFTRSGRAEQRFCSVACSHAGTKKPRYDLHCEHCRAPFRTTRATVKRFCSMRCVALARERVKRLNRPENEPPRVRKPPGRIEWSIFGNERSRGITPTPRDMGPPPRSRWAGRR